MFVDTKWLKTFVKKAIVLKTIWATLLDIFQVMSSLSRDFFSSEMPEWLLLGCPGVNIILASQLKELLLWIHATAQDVLKYSLLFYWKYTRSNKTETPCYDWSKLSSRLVFYGKLNPDHFIVFLFGGKEFLLTPFLLYDEFLICLQPLFLDHVCHFFQLS